MCFSILPLLCCSRQRKTAFDPFFFSSVRPYSGPHKEKKAKGAPAIQRQAGLVSSFLYKLQTEQLPFEVSFIAGTKRTKEAANTPPLCHFHAGCLNESV